MKINRIIEELYYLIDTLKLYDEIERSGSCNDCRNKNNCKYLPEYGSLVRYNCPFYAKTTASYRGREKTRRRDMK